MDDFSVCLKTAAVTVVAMIEAEDQAEDQVGYKETEAENKENADY